MHRLKRGVIVMDLIFFMLSYIIIYVIGVGIGYKCGSSRLQELEGKIKEKKEVIRIMEEFNQKRNEFLVNMKSDYKLLNDRYKNVVKMLKAEAIKEWRRSQTRKRG